MVKKKNDSEPTIKQLEEIMHEVAVEAKKKAEKSNNLLMKQIKEEITLAFQRLNDREQWD
ncbi:MAG: hypothetical protein ACOX2F_12530 [bacterium]